MTTLQGSLRSLLTINKFFSLIQSMQGKLHCHNEFHSMQGIIQEDLQRKSVCSHCSIEFAPTFYYWLLSTFADFFHMIWLEVLEIFLQIQAWLW